MAKKTPKKPSKAEAKKIAKRYDQMTMFETGSPKKDYMKVRLFNPKKDRAPLRYKMAEETASEKKLRLKREKEWGREPTTRGVTYKPRSRKANPQRRHCSMCGLPGHDKRSHRRAPKRRRNMDAFVSGGKIHPIRASKGYEDWLAT